MDQEQLAAGLRARDPVALQALVDLFGDRLFRSACLLCGDQHEAEDIVQEAFFQAFRSASQFRRQSGVYTWLHAILLNVTRHYYRKKKRIIYDEDLANAVAVPAESNPNQMDQEITSRTIENALLKLNPIHREIIVLRFYENMKIREIACHLGLSTGTVKSRLHYATQELQKWVPEEMNLSGTKGTESKVKA